MRFAVYLQLAACGHASPPPARPVERPVVAVADVAGKWRASDDLDFSYTLTIAADGGYDLTVDRNRMGSCRQRGTLAGTGKAWQLALQLDDCRHEQAGTTQALTIESFTGDALTIAVGGDRRAYRRAP